MNSRRSSWSLWNLASVSSHNGTRLLLQWKQLLSHKVMCQIWPGGVISAGSTRAPASALTFVFFMFESFVTIYSIQQYRQVNYCTSQGETPAAFECRIHPSSANVLVTFHPTHCMVGEYINIRSIYRSITLHDMSFKLYILNLPTQ